MEKKKVNCWEFKQCGREPNGNQEQELGVCPTALEEYLHGINDGINAGRACWAIMGTLCCENVDENFATKLSNCMECDFFKQVRAEEGQEFVSTMEIFYRLKNRQEK